MNTESGSMSDSPARLRALDPSASFIVQAPAGSGKTGLLSQRFLVLLATVDAPEEIVAITFTRKAAGEMRQRILLALESAKSSAAPELPHERQTWELAQRALARDKEKAWHLLENPSRLRIQTIDSLCAGLAQQMPILSRFGSVPAITENADELYLNAARNTIAELESGEVWSDSIAHLVKHLDNRLDKLQSLIASMLASRDQWLRHIGDPNHPTLERQNLEAAMAGVVNDALGKLAFAVPEEHVSDLIELSNFAANHLQDSRNSLISMCADLQSLPSQTIEDRQVWEGLSELLLTSDGSWRKIVNKNQGFPAPSSANNTQQKAQFTVMKQRMTALLASLHHESTFHDQLALLQILPPHQYTNDEWNTLQAVIELLRIAAALLQIVFSTQAQVDFTALTQAAIRALGEPEAPTNLALALDYRIRHLLMDEFQDTSFNHIELLRRLTAAWHPDDGHTLFVVGDPMQSIYRFREAEVGIFLAAKKHGIGQLALEPLKLKVNFRSQAGIVDWINQKFPTIMPPIDNIIDGAVSYAESTSFHPQLDMDAVVIHPLLERDDSAEARQVVSIIQQAKIEHPDGTTAILVRSRTHLKVIIEQLKTSKLRYQAVEIERLSHRPLVQDLLALTRALCHLGDRIAWLAVLRAPYCGLTLKDLHVLAGNDSDRSIIDLLHQQHTDHLSTDGQQRIARVLPLLDTALSEQKRSSLRNTIEGVWVALGGPACVIEQTDLNDAEVYFQLLEKLDYSGDGPDIHELNQHVDQLFALPDAEADDSIQLMTIHKAKGLEFDTVILPGLGRTPRHDDSKLLHWLEFGAESGKDTLLLAPLNAHGEEKTPMAAYLQRFEKTKSHYEDCRLLYVAATRAKQRLHLLGHVDCAQRDNGVELNNPTKDSLLARLWPVVKTSFQTLLDQQDLQKQVPENAIKFSDCEATRNRLVLEWDCPSPPKSVQANDIAVTSTDTLLEFDWAGQTARHIGTVIHRLLQYIGEIGAEQIEPSDLRHLEQVGSTMLAQLGIPENRLKTAAKSTYLALQAALDNERGKWILNGLHKEAKCELAISSVTDGKVQHMVIDRTFIDERGTRWIIDYKTGGHSGTGVEEFLDREQLRYQQQLENYASIMKKIESRSIRLGLYFPILAGWREWEYR